MYECFANLPQLHSFGVRLFDLFWRTHYHVNESWEFHFIRHGQLSLEYNGRTYEAGPGDAVLIPARTRHRDNFDPRQDFEVFMASFAWPGAEEALCQFLPGPVLRCRAENERFRVRQYCEHLYLDTDPDSAFDPLLSRSIFHALLLFVLKIANESQMTDRPDKGFDGSQKKKQWLIDEVKNYIRRNYQSQVSLEELARSLGVSQYYLSRVFNAESGFSLPEFLTMVRMQKAKVLLKEGQKNISEVAYEVGYESSSYFAKVYRKHFGINPGMSAMSHPVKRV
ncbi:MAG: AraC family transcriptional regulator [Oligosphaeraceae bacterium]|nr:AraC family transcriptional regulator [Oligosphaeraceae bacterium]